MCIEVGSIDVSGHGFSASCGDTGYVAGRSLGITVSQSWRKYPRLGFRRIHVLQLHFTLTFFVAINVGHTDNLIVVFCFLELELYIWCFQKSFLFDLDPPLHVLIQKSTL